MRLRELREEKKLTQKEVADAVGGTQSNLAKWEKGKIQPAADMVIKLADFFGVSADYLLGRSDDLGYVTVQSSAPPLSPEEQKLIEDYRGLGQPLKDLLQEMIRTWQSSGVSADLSKNKKIK